MSDFVAFVHRVGTPAATAAPRNGVPRWATTVAPVGGGTAAPADAVDGAVGAAEEAAPGWHAAAPAARGRTGSEVRDGSFPGTVETQKDERSEKDKRWETDYLNVLYAL